MPQDQKNKPVTEMLALLEHQLDSQAKLGSTKPSDLWKLILQVQLNSIRADLSPKLAGIIQFTVYNQDSLSNNFYLVLNESTSQFFDGNVEDAEISCEVTATESLVKDILCGKEPQSQNLFIQRNDKLFTDLLELISTNSAFAMKEENACC